MVELVPVDHDPFVDSAAAPYAPSPRVSTRFPTAARRTEDPFAQPRLGNDLESFRRDPTLYKHNVGLVRAYPNLPDTVRRKGIRQVEEAFIEHAKHNLLWLHDQMPKEVRARAHLWYEGGNRLVHEMAKHYGYHPNSVAAAIAALSPQKDWFQNVSLAHRVIDTTHRHGGVTFTKEMAKKLRSIKAFAGPLQRELTKALTSKRLDDLTDSKARAAWIRLFDEAHNPRHHHLITPEGVIGDVVRNEDKDKTPSGTGWGSLKEISKAVSALRAAGDVNAISPLLGERHKVRNFYNNLIDPNSPAGDVTIDTHAVAAALLRPLSGNSLEVGHNFANYVGKAGDNLPQSKASAVTGIQGTYPLYAEAYRRAAAERGILPRQMQSITWEGARGLFQDKFKAQAKNVKAIDDIWREYQKGRITLHAARQRILDRAGGIKAPDWHV